VRFFECALFPGIVHRNVLCVSMMCGGLYWQNGCPSWVRSLCLIACIHHGEWFSYGEKIAGGEGFHTSHRIDINDDVDNKEAHTIMTIQKKVEKFLRSMWRGKAGDFSAIPDPRSWATKHPWENIVSCLALGLQLNLRTLRDVEDLSGEIFGNAHRISDTTFDSALRNINPDALLGNVVTQIRSLHRSKRLLMSPGMPLKVMMLDGKNLSTLTHNAGGSGHRRTSDTAKWFKGAPDGKPYWIVPVLRAALISTPSKPCVMQVTIPSGQGESSLLSTRVDALQAHYGRADLFETLMMDAGLTSLANANHIIGCGYSYIMALKGNQPTLHDEAQRVFAELVAQQRPAACTEWEKHAGKRVRRQLWRSTEMAGFASNVGVWGHLCEAWYVLQERHDPATHETTLEHRYYITSVNPRKCTPAQCLNIVRASWGIENDVFNSLDLQWREDSGVWCTHGNAVLALGLLRMLAYNLAQFTRRKILRAVGAKKKPSWRAVFDALRQAARAIAWPVRNLTEPIGVMSQITG
jgi:hypothetical protein